MDRVILIVEPGAENRSALKNILGGEYRYLEAENGAEALKLLEHNCAFVSAVFMDIPAPAGDGLETLEKVRGEDRYAHIPILVTADPADGAARDRALALGANAFVPKPYNPATARSALEGALRLCEAVASVKTLRRDKVTGLLNREAFIAEAGRMIRDREPGRYVLSCLNIDSFKVINDQHGMEKGDAVLRHVGQVLHGCMESLGGVCCRYSADKFAALYPVKFMGSESVLRCHQEAERPEVINRKIKIRIGRCIVDDVSLPVGSLYDRAVMAQESIHGRYDMYIAMYHKSMRDQMLHEQRIVTEMYDALREGQFETWFQPQYNHATGATIGAEALVRWRRPGDGLLVPPGNFIPVFERNGFIYELDKYIWEQVCGHLRRWLDEGRNPLPVSVNISRYDVLMPDFFDVLTGLIRRYAIPIDLLRLEVTETAFTQSTELIVTVIKRLMAFGFTVELDDFGSGYSSLNVLKDVPASILKLDMRFLEDSEDSKRGGNILESVVRMAKWLDMAIIAEGVETRAQADFLKSIGCLYVQGYLYARPMPLAEYEAFAAGEKKERRLESLRTVKHLNSNAFWDPGSVDSLIFNSFIGGACIMEERDGRVEVLRVNDKCVREIGSAGMTLADALKVDWVEYLDDEGKGVLFDALQHSVETGEEHAAEYLFHRLPGCGEKTYLRATLQVIATSKNRRLIYCMVENVTALHLAVEKEHEAERERQAAAEQLAAIMDNVNGSVTATVVEDGVLRILFANERFYQIIGYTKEQYAAERVNPFDLLHPEDRAAVIAAGRSASDAPRAMSVSYRIVCRDGVVRWMQANLSVIRLPGTAAPVHLGVANDITEQRLLERRERETSAQMQAILENVNGGVAAVTVEGGVIRYIFANNEHYAMFGYTREQFERELPRGLLDIIHPDDLPAVRAAVAETQRTGKPMRIEYRARRRDGSEIWVHSSGSSCQIEGVGGPVHISVFVDITEQKQAADHFRFLNDMAHEILAQRDPGAGVNGMLRRLLEFFSGDRVYIFEVDEERGEAHNTYEVCAEGVASKMDALRNVPAASLSFWLDALARQDYVYIRDFDRYPMIWPEKARLQAHGIESVVSVPLRRAGAIIGFIGLDNARRNQSHIGRIVALGDYVAVLLTRRDDEAKLAGHAREQEQMMQDMPGGYAKMRITASGIVPVFLNDEFCRLCGMTRRQAMALYGDDAYSGVHPDDAEAVRAILREAIDKRSTVTLRIRLARGDGGYAPMRVFYRVTEDADGNLNLNGYYSGTTERDRVEARRRDLMDNLPGGAALYAYDGKRLSAIYLNKRYWELVGRKPVRHGAASFLKAVHPEDLPAIMRELDASIRQRRDFSCDARVLYGKGDYRLMHIAAKIADQGDGKYLFYALYTPLAGAAAPDRKPMPAALAAAITSSFECTFVKDRDLRYLCASDDAARNLGFESDSALIGKTDHEIMDRTRAEQYARDERRILKTGEIFIDMEQSGPAEQAPSQHFMIAKYPLRGADGDILGILGVRRDITQLYEAAFELDTLLNVIPSGVFKYSADERGEFAYVSRIFMERLGYSESGFREKFGNSFREMVYAPDRDRVEREIAEQENAGGIGKLAYRIEAADGHIRWFRNEGVRVTDQSGKAWYYVTLMDITEHRASEEKLRLLIDSIRGGLATFEYGPDGIRTLYVNDGLFRILGYSREEYAALTAGDPLALVHEADRPAFNLAFRPLLQGVEGSATCVFRSHTRDGGNRWFSMSAGAAGTRNGAVRFNAVLYDITAQKNVEQQLRVREEEYRLATLHSNVSIGRYTIGDRRLSITLKNADRCDLPTVLEDVPYGQVNGGDISADTLENYVAFYERIMRGEKDGMARYQRKVGGQWKWMEANFSTLFSDDGKPVSAIISFREVTEQIEREAIYKKWTQSLSDRPEASYTLLRVNLARDTLDAEEGALLGAAPPPSGTPSFSGWVRHYAGGAVYADDREKCLAALSVDALRAGGRAVVFEYREIAPQDTVRWLRVTAEMVEYPGSSDVMAYLLFEDIDERKRAELRTQSRAETDPLTGLYNRSAFTERVEALIKRDAQGRISALFLLDMDGFKGVNDHFGHIAGDQALIRVGGQLRSILRREDLICRLGGDEFMVFLANAPDGEAVEKKAQQILALFRPSAERADVLSASVGIAVFPEDGRDFETLYQKADIALYHVKRAGKNNYAFYAEGMAAHQPDAP